MTSVLNLKVMRVLPLFVLLLLAACSSKQLPVVEPAALLPLKSEFGLTSLWSVRFSMEDTRQAQARTPVISNGHVFVSDDVTTLKSLDTVKGKRQWRLDTKMRLSSGVAINDNQLLVASEEGDVLAYDVSNGLLLWRSRVSSEVLKPPIVAGDIIIVCSIDGRLTALNAFDGRRLWSHETSVPALSLHGISRPVVSDGKVIAGLADGKLLALSIHDGRVLWETSIATASGKSELERLIDIDADLIVQGNVAYAAAFQGRVAAVDIRSGRLIWARDMSVYKGLLADEQAVYVVNEEDVLSALSVDNGATLWQQEALRARQITAPQFHQDYLLVGDYQGYLHWLNRHSGEIVARHRADLAAIIAVQVDSADAVYALGRKGSYRKAALVSGKVSR